MSGSNDQMTSSPADSCPSSSSVLIEAIRAEKRASAMTTKRSRKSPPPDMFRSIGSRSDSPSESAAAWSASSGAAKKKA